MKKCYIPKANVENPELFDIYEIKYDEKVLFSARDTILSDPILSTVRFAGFSERDLNCFYEQYGKDKVVGVFQSYYKTDEGERYCGTVLKESVHPIFVLINNSIDGDADSLYELYVMAKEKIGSLESLKAQNDDIMKNINLLSEREVDSIVKTISDNNMEIGQIESNPTTKILKQLYGSITVSLVESVEYSKICSDSLYSDIHKLLVNRK